MGRSMKKEYDIEKLNPRKNPYAKAFKQQITINLNVDVIEYFKEQSSNTGIPYQSLINLYLEDCVQSKKTLNLEWK